MIMIKNKSSLAKMEEAGRLLSGLFDEIVSVIRSGVSTLELDAWIEGQLRSRGLVPRSKGYGGYKHSSCISVNDVVIHGVPCADCILQAGDLVKIDIIASWKGYCADMARPFFVDGIASSSAKNFVAVAQTALDKGIEMARAGNRVSDISAVIQREVEQHGFGVIRDFAGHGIGKNMHEEPEVPNFGRPGTGPVLQPGMVIAIEPMITMGDYKVDVMSDGWTVKTCDKSLATHVEDTIAVTNGDPKILTRSEHREGGL